MYTFYTTASEASPLTTARPTFGSETGNPIFPYKNEEPQHYGTELLGHEDHCHPGTAPAAGAAGSGEVDEAVGGSSDHGRRGCSGDQRAGD